MMKSFIKHWWIIVMVVSQGSTLPFYLFYLYLPYLPKKAISRTTSLINLEIIN